LWIHGVPLGGGFVRLSYDLPFTMRNDVWADQAVIVYLDEASGKELNQPSDAPWDRSLHAQLLDRLKADQARAVVFDILFTTPGAADADQKFADAIKSFGKVVLGAEVVPIQGDNTGPGDNRATGYALSRPFDLFLRSAAGIGLVNHMVDADRTVRQHFPGVSVENEPSLAWAAAQLVGASVTRDPRQSLMPRWIQYYGPPGTVPHVSYYQVIRGNLSPGLFRDKVVFVGARPTAGFTGTAMDEFRSPYARRGFTTTLFCPGVEVHATAFLNLVRNDWVSRLNDAAELTVLILAGIVFGYGLTLLRPVAAIAGAVVGGAAICAAAYLLFTLNRTWFAWMIIIAAQIPLALFYSVVVNWLELYVQKRLLEHSLALHLPPKRIKQFVRQPELLKPGATKQMLSIMFTDIENFTKMSEGMDSDDLARVMNEYFETKIPCVHEADGTVIKLIGDAILAVWNAPDQQPNHRELACRGAILLHDEDVQFTRDQTGLRLRTRIGVHTGLANVGNFGSATRIDYTAIGENVNLASRLEGLNKYLGTDILVSRDTQEGTGERILARPVGLYRLKGFEKAVEVFELVGFADRAESTRAWRETFERALNEFQQRNFDAAEHGFRCTLEIHPEDGPSKFYLQQIGELRLHPPGANWNGEIELKDK
jgi:adenylate cyclase